MQRESTKPNKTSVKEYKIRAGEMQVVGEKVKPNPDKGEIRFFINREELLNFEWRNLDKKSSIEPLVIFEGEWEWKKISTGKGRVYVLQNKTFIDDQLFFWMQYPNTAEDKMNETIITNILNTGKLEIDETTEGEVSLEGIESILKKEGEGINNNLQNNQINQGGNPKLDSQNLKFIQNLANSMKMEKEKFPPLGKILTKINVIKVLDENNIQELIK